MAGTIDIKPATKLRLALDESAFLVSIPLVDGKAYIPDENQKILFQYGAGEETQVLAGYVDDLFSGVTALPEVLQWCAATVHSFIQCRKIQMAVWMIYDIGSRLKIYLIRVQTGVAKVIQPVDSFHIGIR